MMHVELNFIIYTLIPYKGYGIRAWSRNANIIEFSEALKDWFSPYEQSLIKQGYETRAIIKSFKDVVYLSRIFLGNKLDELNRDGIVSHIMAIPTEVLKNGLTFETIEKEMVEYVNKSGIKIGEINPVEFFWEKTDVDSELEYFKKMVSKDHAKRILEGLNNPYPKIVIIFKRGVWDRAKLAYSLAKVLQIHGVRTFAILIDKPIDAIYLLYENLILILDKMIPLKQVGDWTIINIDVKEDNKKTSDVEETLRKIYNNQ